MEKTITVELTITVDDETIAFHGGRWLEAFKESCDEFIAELEKFINEHPFYVACSVKPTIIEPETDQ
jgi:hypothetical protein